MSAAIEVYPMLGSLVSPLIEGAKILMSLIAYVTPAPIQHKTIKEGSVGWVSGGALRYRAYQDHAVGTIIKVEPSSTSPLSTDLRFTFRVGKDYNATMANRDAAELTAAEAHAAAQEATKLRRQLHAEQMELVMQRGIRAAQCDTKPETEAFAATITGVEKISEDAGAVKVLAATSRKRVANLKKDEDDESPANKARRLEYNK
jgi:hypothetical protein